ncbi:hypothetical protein [Fischerella sp. PCC 9605]|uniref:hypothetical protein n=1 Tax=Fischerella sp. PCC 9605 TaxID=1173024 RepID=UPI0004B9CC3F|nr:hypothetical protein [Fischerella sp. PCC 9605]
MEDKKRIQVNFRLDKNLFAAIQAKCKADNITQTDFIIQALKKALSSNTSTVESIPEVLSSLYVRLAQVETRLADNLAIQQRLSERLTALEQQPNTSPPNLEALSERVLAQLHLGKQAPGYKAAKKALSNFIAQLSQK